jgi:CelD/BcsL family acetyltransferase involved in cellulose biosynthesis
MNCSRDLRRFGEGWLLSTHPASISDTRPDRIERPRPRRPEAASTQRDRPQPGSDIAAPARPYATIAVSRDIDDFAAFWPRSTALSGSRQFIFQCADTLQAWCDTIGRAQAIEPLFVAVLDDARRPLLLLPLGLERRAGIRVLGFLDGTVSDFNAPVLFSPAQHWDSATMAALWQDIQRRLPGFDVAIFRKLPEMVDDWTNPLRHLVTARSTQGSYAMALPQQWVARDVLPDLKDSRRRARKLARLGRLSFKVAATSAEAEAFTRAAIAMKGRQFVKTLGTDRFAVEPGYAAYYIETTRRLFHTGAIHASALQINDRILAAQWGYIYGNRFYHMLTAYEGSGNWPSYSPGRLLTEHLIQRCVNARIARFDFGVGDESYKSSYCDERRVLFDAVLPVTLKGRLYALSVDFRRNSTILLRNTRFAAVIQRLLRAIGHGQVR